MTGQLESDVRSLLARHAATIHPDAAGGEQAIARRLEAGDVAVAEVISLDPPRRRVWLAAAAFLLVAAVGAGAFAATRGGDSEVQTGPVATAPDGRAAILELRPVMAMGPCADMGASAYAVPGAEGTCYALGEVLVGNPLLRAAGVFASFSGIGEAIDGGDTPGSVSEETYGVTLTFTSDGIEQVNALVTRCFERSSSCPTGQLAIVVDGEVLSAPTIQQPEYEADQIEITGDFTEAEAEELAASLQPRPGNDALAERIAREQATQERLDAAQERAALSDPTVGDHDDAAKDVAERAARELLGADYITTAADSDGALTWVTMDGPGGAVVAEVVQDGEGAHRLLGIQPSAGPDQILEVPPGGPPVIAVPEPGDVTFEVFGQDFEELLGGTSVGNQGDDIELDLPVAGTPRWIAIRLETPDGRLLAWLEAIGD